LGFEAASNPEAQLKAPSPCADKCLQDPTEAMRQLTAGKAEASGEVRHSFALSPGEPAKDGGTVSLDAKGNRTTLYKNGASRVENIDGSGKTLTPGTNGAFNEHAWYPAPEHFWQSDRNKKPNRVLTGEQVLAQRRETLSADAEQQIKNAADLKTFQDNMHLLEERAKKAGVSPGQLAQTYLQEDTLLTSVGDMQTDTDDRRALAEQVMSQAADPGKVRQGAYNTCGAAGLEVEAYTKHPESAARLVADVALTGQYTALDGTTVRIDPTPQGRSLTDDAARVRKDPEPTDRSYASQLFQVAAVNVALDQVFKNDKVYDRAVYMQKSYVLGNQRIEDGIYQYKKNKDSEYVAPFPGLASEYVARAHDAIVGHDDLVIMHLPEAAQTNFNAQTPVIQSEAQLNQILAHANMPALILVNADNAPFEDWAKDKNGRYLDHKDLAHFVVVNGYKAGPQPAAELYNTQGRTDPFGQGGELSVHDLYQATLPRKDAIAALQKDMQQDQASGQSRPLKQLQLLRLQVEEGQCSHAQAEQALRKITAQMYMAKTEGPKELSEIGKIAEQAKISKTSLRFMGVGR
jgi:hypothetical protein